MGEQQSLLAPTDSQGKSWKPGGLADGGEGLGAEADGILGSGGADSQVSHLSPRAGLGFAVQMENSAGEAIVTGKQIGRAHV